MHWKKNKNGDNDNNQKIYAYIACILDNDESKRRYFGDSSQMTSWLLDSGATRHIIPQVLGLILVSLENTNKHIEFADGHHVTTKQKGQVWIKLCDDNGDTFIATLHNVLLTPDLCNRLFLIITSMSLVHTYLFHKWFFTVYFGDKEKNAVALPHSAQRKHTFLGEIKNI